jgi:hypothetical protein
MEKIFHLLDNNFSWMKKKKKKKDLSTLLDMVLERNR